MIISDNNSVVHSFIGKHADDLGNLISDQIKPIYQSLGIIVPVKSCSIVHALYAAEQASLTDLSKTLNQSHQLIKQKLPRLMKLELIVMHKDTNDKRRFLYKLTEVGIKQAKLLNENSLEKVYTDLSNEINTDLYQVLVAAIDGLKKKDLLTRFKQQINQ